MSVARLLSAIVLALLLSGLSRAAERATDLVGQGLERKVTFHVLPAPLTSALDTFSQQSGIGLMYPHSTAIARIRSNAVSGDYSVAEALQILLAGCPVSYTFISPRMIALRLQTAPLPGDTQSAGSNWWEPSRPQAVPEILIEGSRSLNADIPRSPDDVQNYIVISRRHIESSPATDVTEVLQQYLALNTRPHLAGATVSAAGNSPQIDLRGLGSNQTLILLNGRRAPLYSFGGLRLQPDLNAIPLAAIERIEILPASASAIYGGDATAGVVNIVLRSDFNGTEFKAGYGATASADTQAKSFSFITGQSFNRHRTQYLLTGSFEKELPLLMAQRSFMTDGRNAVVQNNPDYFPLRVAPPLGSRPNISTLSGAPLAPGLSSFASLPRGYKSSDGAARLVANSGQYDLGLAASAQADGGARYALRNGFDSISLHGAISHDFTNTFTAFSELDFARSTFRTPMSAAEFIGLNGAVVHATAPNNPSGQDLLVTVPSGAADGTLQRSLGTWRINIGAKTSLGSSWAVEGEYGISHSTLEWSQPTGISARPEIADGRLDVLRDTNEFPLDLTRWMRTVSTSPLDAVSTNLTVRWSGPLFKLPAGEVMSSSLIEDRREHFRDALELMDSGPGTPLRPTTLLSGQRQHIRSAATQVTVPIIAPWEELGGSPRLELLGAMRFDDYRAVTGTPRTPIELAGTNITDANPDAALSQAIANAAALSERSRSQFSSTNHTFGARWSPIPDVLFRWSTGTAFLPPSAAELAPPMERQFPAGILSDPRRGNEPTGEFALVAGGNSGLHPERSRSNSFGVRLTPRFWPGFGFSLDYTRIHKVDDIQSPPLDLEHLDAFEELFESRVTRAQPEPNDSYGIGRITAIDATDINIAEADVTAWDAALAYNSPRASWGQLGILARATWQPELRTRTTPGRPFENVVGTSSEAPLPLSAVSTITYAQSRWSISWSTQYFSSYDASSRETTVRNQGGRRVSAQVYHDLFFTYNLDPGHSSAVRTDLELSIRNVFNTRPPYDAGAASNGYYSAFGDPRLTTYTLFLNVRF